MSEYICAQLKGMGCRVEGTEEDWHDFPSYRDRQKKNSIAHRQQSMEAIDTSNSGRPKRLFFHLGYHDNIKDFDLSTS
jgi:hypothetical protein